jgi:hypothetical protein
MVRGLKPWFPWPLSRWRWLTEPVRAERLAALRIGVAFFMLLDVFSSFYLASSDYYGRNSLGEPSVYATRFEDGLRWSLLKNVWEPSQVKLLMTLWVLASFFLLIGLFSRTCAAYSFAMSVSIAHSNSNIDNAGDNVRLLILFYLMLCPCGAAWSVASWLRRRFYWTAARSEDGAFRGLALVRRAEPLRTPVFVYPWALRLLFVQMMLIYECNGIAKSVGDTWHDGHSLYYVLCDLTLSRYSYAMFPLPLWMTQYMTWMVLWWEILFAPVMLVPWRTLADLLRRVPWVGRAHVLLRYNREIFLCFGASFHLGIFLGMEIGGFPWYMLCLYLPLLPWERFRRARVGPAVPDSSPSDTAGPTDGAATAPQPSWDEDRSVPATTDHPVHPADNDGAPGAAVPPPPASENGDPQG